MFTESIDKKATWQLWKVLTTQLFARGHWKSAINRQKFDTFSSVELPVNSVRQDEVIERITPPLPLPQSITNRVIGFKVTGT